MNLRQVAKKAIGWGAGHGGLRLFLQGKVAVFMFHRVVSRQYYDATHFQRPVMVTQEAFGAFLGWVRKNFTVAPLSALLQPGVARLNESSQPVAIIIFDDGWRDNFEFAFPLLQREKLPAAIFLTTGYIDGSAGFWWQELGDILSDPDLPSSTRQKTGQYLREICGGQGLAADIHNSIDQLIKLIKTRHAGEAESICSAVYQRAGRSRTNLCLSWDQCRQMSDGLIEFGSHTVSHARLTTVDGGQLEEELRQSRLQLIDKQVCFADAICYPYGDYDQRVAACAAKYYRLGLTTAAGLVVPDSAPGMSIPRINIPEKIIRNRSLFWYRMLKAALQIRRR